MVTSVERNFLQLPTPGGPAGRTVIGVNVPGNATSPSTAIPFHNVSNGTIAIAPNSSSVTTLTWYHSPDGTNWYALIDSSGNAVTSTIAGLTSSVGVSSSIPVACFGCGWIAPVGNQASGMFAVTYDLKG